MIATVMLAAMLALGAAQSTPDPPELSAGLTHPVIWTNTIGRGRVA